MIVANPLIVPANHSCRQDALEYLAMGFSVIPLRGSGSVEDRKRPVLDSWERFQRERATPDEVGRWFDEHPRANLGIVTGAVSGIFVLDLDGKNAQALVRKAGILLPKTACAATGNGGWHYYFRHPGVRVPNRVKLLSDGNGSAVDVRGDGGYVVAPPSIHGSGRAYCWIVPLEEGIADAP